MSLQNFWRPAYLGLAFFFDSPYIQIGTDLPSPYFHRRLCPVRHPARLKLSFLGCTDVEMNSQIAADTYLLKLQCLQSKILFATGNFPRHTPIPAICIWLSKSHTCMISSQNNAGSK